MESTRSEDCLIFYGFTPKITKMRQVFSSIADFMKNKQFTDPSDRFNLIVFQHDGPNYLEHFTFNQDHILNNLKSMSGVITNANIAGGIFIAITFIIEVYKKISEKIFRLLILIDEGAYDIPPEYLPPIEELVKVVKDLPFFIDIVRVGQPNSELSTKLMKLTKLSNGEYYEIASIKDLDPILTTLSEKKYISDPLFVKQGLRMILPDNQPFYINLADEPEIIDETATCSICFKSDNENLVKCPSCESIAHKVCWAQWSETSNIGIPYVFRCHNCFNILKLEKSFVNDVKAGKIPTIAELSKVKKKNIIEYLHELEEKTKPKIVQAEDPMAAAIRAKIEEKEIKPQPRETKKRSHVNICPNCSKIIMGARKSCPSCGFVLF
ncbi:MAG: vWA domain-containing protein [Candidatus Thorarchaeota archaeon]